MVGGGYDHHRRAFLMYAWAKRATTEEMRQQIFRVNHLYRPREIGVEANAQQSLFVYDVWDFARARGIRLPLSMKYQPSSVDKDFRVRTAINPRLSNGQLFFHPSLTEAIHEVQAFPMSPLKDIVDAIASWLAMIPPPIPKRAVDDELAGRLEYLRSTPGVPLDYIARVARGEV